MTDTSRPLSPHLQVYRFSYTMATSIFHRATGIVLSVGYLGFVVWLMALASGRDSHEGLHALLGSLIGRLLVVGFLGAFWYHTFAGLRHLGFDAGIGLNKAAARRSATWLLIATLVAVAASAALVLSGGRS